MTHHLPSTIKPLIGKTIVSASKKSDAQIEVVFSDGTLSVFVQGDCCSSSVFYDLVFPESCVGSQLIDVIEHEWCEPKLTEKEVAEMAWGIGASFECASIWDVQIITSKGIILLRHANDSNGYYDGYTSYNFEPIS